MPAIRRYLIALTASLALVVGACSTSNGDSSSDGDPAAPGPLTIATSFGIDDLDPMENSFWGPEFGYVELLMHPERNGTPSPWVLKKLESTDSLTWTLTLNDGVVFENGRKLDAAALVELLTYCNANNPGFAAAAEFASATATGPLEVTYKTTQPVPGLAAILADESNVPVFDVQAYQAYLASKASPEALLAAGLYTGPYMVDSLSTEVATLKPVANYWAGTPALTGMTIKFVPEATARLQAVQAGEADIALYMPTSIARTLKGRADAYYVTGEPSGTAFAFQLNNVRTPYDDSRVRRAVYAAVDYKALADDVLSGLADVATSVFGHLPYAIDTQKTDLAEARSLLDQAGWTTGSDGIRAKGGKKLTLTLLSYPQQPDSNTIAVALQSELKQVGIDVQVNQVPDITASREGGDWDGAIVGDSLLSFPLSPIDGLRDDLMTGADQNYMKVSNAELDTVIAQLGVEFDKTRQRELLEQAQQIIADNGLWAATVLRLPAVVTNGKWKGYEPPIANLWVSAKTAPSS